MGRTIAITLPKGGVGKTTTAVNLAASLAAEGARTLLVDLDPIGSSGSSLGFIGEMTTAGLYDIFNFTSSVPSAIHRTDVQNLDFIPCNARTVQREERIARLADNRTILRNLIRPVSGSYDYVILDCPPTLRGLATVALAAADSVLIPVRAGHFSLDAVDKLFVYMDWLREVTNRPITVDGILITMHEPRTTVTEITLRELNAKYRHLLFSTKIPKNTVLSEASFFGKPAILYNAASKGSEAYRELARELRRRHMTASSLRPTVMEKIGMVG